MLPLVYNSELIEQLVRPENYFKDPKEVRELRHKAIKMAHKFHYNNNAFYHNYCKMKV